MAETVSTGEISELKFVNPNGLYNPAHNGYSHLSLFPADWRIILPAGQGGETEDQVLSDDFRTQLKQAVRNTEIVLAAPGAKISDVAKFTLYVVDHDKRSFASSMRSSVMSSVIASRRGHWLQCQPWRSKACWSR